jgi:dephospho-CoA kinase
VHELLANSDPARHAIIELFGPKIVTKNGAIDRAALAHIVFSHEDSRKQLEAIVHPAVVLECRKRIENQKGAELIAVLVPLLFEAGLANEYDEVWTVITAEPILKERMMQREDLNQSLFEQRLAAQWPQEKKASLAKHVIDNSGTLEETKHQVELLLKHLICSQ